MFLASIRKSSLYAMKIYGAIIASVTISIHAAADSAAIIGGIDLTGTGPAYAALISSSNGVTPLALPGDAAMGGIISSVSMNSSGNSLIGGQGFYDAQPAYVGSVSASGVLTSLTLTEGIATDGTILSVAINPSGNGIVGGRDLITTNGWINSVALLPFKSLLREIPTAFLSGNNLITEKTTKTIHQG